MPELPEVETTLRGIAPWVVGRTVERVIIRNGQLRWPVPANLHEILAGQTVLAIERRAKYLLLQCPGGWLILHLGMTGRLHLVERETPAGRHDHVDFVFSDGQTLRYNDSRRFGAILWTADHPHAHSLLVDLGCEPLAAEVTGDYLFELSRRRTIAVKSFIMDHRIIVGVGNIYASEALHRAGIHPGRAAGRISCHRYGKLVLAIREVLEEAIAAGGTTLKDFLDAGGRPGYFSRQLRVYGRAGEPCTTCGSRLQAARINGRSTYFCGRCQR